MNPPTVFRKGIKMIYYKKFEEYINKQVMIYTNHPETFTGKLLSVGSDGNYFPWLKFADGTLMAGDAVISIRELSIKAPKTSTIEESNVK